MKSIKKNGFVIRTAYPKTDWYGRRKVPDRVGLCPLFWRFLWFGTTGLVKGAITFGVALAFVGLVLWSFYELLFTVIPLGIQKGYHDLVEHPSRLTTWQPWAVGVGVATCVPLFLLARRAVRKVRQTEVYRLFAARLKAKKERICPMLQVVE